MTNMGSIIGYRIDYNGVGFGEASGTYPAKIEPSTPPPEYFPVGMFVLPYFAKINILLLKLAEVTGMCTNLLLHFCSLLCCAYITATQNVPVRKFSHIWGLLDEFTLFHPNQGDNVKCIHVLQST